MTTSIAIAAGNLPAEPNSFVGRERDLAELELLLVEVRALTLCGPGGIGKTRLALRLACDLSEDFPDGTWLVEVADTEDPSLVPQRVAAILGVRAEPDRPLAETLTDALRPQRLLLILDTCEHVVDACAALVQHILSGCPWVRVIATSREPLRVRGETVWRVPPLELPREPGGGPEDDPGRHESMRLFAERATAVRTGFTLGADNVSTVAQLCRTLDGMPLAIELAAARVRALSVDQIAERLRDRFMLLASGDRTAPARQQTLRAAVDWSYELLTEPEKVLLRRLSVFSGWTLEMAEDVCADASIPADMVLDLLISLIDKSLVTADHEVAGAARYRLLDTIREYATGRLIASGEEMVVRRRHRDHMLRLAQEIVSRAFVRGDPPWPERVALYSRSATERANWRAALSTSLDRGDAEEGIRLCMGLRSPWIANGDVAEGVGWFDRFLALPGDVPPAIRGHALVLRAELAFEQQDYLTAFERAEAGLALCRSAGDSANADGLRMLALVSLRAGDQVAALARIDEAIASARAAGDVWEEGLGLNARAAVIARQGALREAQRTYEAALDVLRDNNGWGIAQVLYGLGGVARARGDHRAALGHFRDALALYREIDARPDIARCLVGIGWVALAQDDLALTVSGLTESLELSLATGQRLLVARGLEAFAVVAARMDDAPRSVRLAGSALDLRSAAGQTRSAGAGARLEDLLEPARRRLGEAATAALLTEGRAMTADQAVRYAVSAGGLDRPEGRNDGMAARVPAPGDGGTGQGVPSALTPREREIAAMIARGLTNRGIADELVISQATVARHVANILIKLGFSSRAQVAAWMARREPGTAD
jgi:predicted ATPase/DNA-binding CsgD family transcriptional regulator/Tfp pilus assembly protein PilF